MDNFKIQNFLKAHPGLSPPDIRRVDQHFAHLLRNRIALQAGLTPDSTDLELTRRITQNATQIGSVDARAAGFEFQRLLLDLGIRPAERVYVNWYRFDEVDSLPLVDLSRFFTDVWYRDSDDIEIFDDSCAWIVAVSHSGDVGLAVLEI